MEIQESKSLLVVCGPWRRLEGMGLDAGRGLASVPGGAGQERVVSGPGAVTGLLDRTGVRRWGGFGVLREQH